MPIQKAFISDAAFTIDDHGYAAVVTAEFVDRSADKLEFTCDILGYVEPISITLDQDDLDAMRELLGLPDKHAIEKFHDAAMVAFAALEEIAALGTSAERAVEIAEEALSRINGGTDD